MRRKTICLLLALCVALSLFTGCAQLIDIALSQLAAGGGEATQSGGLIDEVPVTEAEPAANVGIDDVTIDDVTIDDVTIDDVTIDDVTIGEGASQDVDADPQPTFDAETLDERGYYYSRDDVALYIHTYGCLPDNFITKNQARELGWEGGGLGKYAPDMCIGGDRFGNYEGALPNANGRKYTECDIDTLGKSSRGAKRIVFSNDGLVYYTGNHYETFTLLYGEE